MGITANLPDQEPVFIASWKGFRAFQDALEQLGVEHFPMILDQLPDGDEGETSPEKAAAMLAELKHFLTLQEQVQQAVLVDTERSTDISMGSNVLGGALTINRAIGYDIGFDADGFFIRDRLEMNRILFRAMRVEQRLIQLETNTVEYVNLESGQQFQCNAPFGQPITSEDGIPRMAFQQFHVEIRAAAPNRFAYITTPLQSILEQSIASSVTIKWV